MPLGKRAEAQGYLEDIRFDIGTLGTFKASIDEVTSDDLNAYKELVFKLLEERGLSTKNASKIFKKLATYVNSNQAVEAPVTQDNAALTPANIKEASTSSLNTNGAAKPGKAEATIEREQTTATSQAKIPDDLSAILSKYDKVLPYAKGEKSQDVFITDRGLISEEGKKVEKLIMRLGTEIAN